MSDGRVTLAVEGRGVTPWGSGPRRVGRGSERLRGGEEESGEGRSVHSMSGQKKTCQSPFSCILFIHEKKRSPSFQNMLLETLISVIAFQFRLCFLCPVKPRPTLRPTPPRPRSFCADWPGEAVHRRARDSHAVSPVSC